MDVRCPCYRQRPDDLLQSMLQQEAILVSEVWVPVSGHVDPSGHVGVHNPVAAQVMLMSAACVTTEGHGVPGQCCCLKLC